MKAAAIALSILVLVFLANVMGIFLSPAYKQTLQGYFGSRNSVVQAQSDVLSDEYKGDVVKLQNTLEQLTAGLEAISQTGATNVSGSGITNVSSTATGVSVLTGSITKPGVPPKEEPKEYKLSIALQARLMPDVFVKKAESKGIFDIKIYSNLDYTMYRDEKNKMNVYAFSDSYPVILANLKLASNVYSVKETDSFFEASFFLNSSNSKDTTVRFVTSLEGRAYGFEVPKTFYPRLKKLLINK